jgi:hypothetical protein
MFASGSGFPPLLERWLSAVLAGPIPAEPRTTCGDCAMLRPEPFPGETRFERSTKCCTFFPVLASFEVGGLLLDEDPGLARGRARVRQRVLEGLHASPLGLGRPPIFLEVYQPESAFGRAQALRCPYYIDEDGGLCGVWRHREATCATWFCKHERGRVGHHFWLKVHQLLKNVEHWLSVSIALELGIERDALDALEPAPYDVVRDDAPDFYRAVWGPWAGRELEYYEESARRVAALDWPAVRARGGVVLDPLIAEVEAAERLLTEPEPLPARVQVVCYERLGSTGTRVRLRSYSEFNPLDVPAAVADAVPRLITKTAAEAGLDDAALRQLIDYGVVAE